MSRKPSIPDLHAYLQLDDGHGAALAEQEDEDHPPSEERRGQAAVPASSGGAPPAEARPPAHAEPVNGHGGYQPRETASRPGSPRKLVPPHMRKTPSETLSELCRRSSDLSDVLTSDEVFSHATHGSRYGLASSRDLRREDEVDVQIAVDLRLRLEVFVEMFLVHVFFPLSLPIFAWRRGMQAVYNVQLIRWKRDYKSYFNWMAIRIVYDSTWIMFWWIIVGYIWKRDELAREDITFAEMFQPLMLVLSHRAMVSVKYGTMSPKELQLYFTVDRDRALAYNERIQLLSGWWDPSRDMIYKEIYRAWQVCGARRAREWRACAHALVLLVPGST